jgi:hypothetical protein
MFKNILLPTDGSNLSQVAIQKGMVDSLCGARI